MLVEKAEAVAVSKAARVPVVLKEKARRRKSKEAAPANLKGKEDAPSYAKSKRKTVDSSTEGAPNEKLLASAML